jgi:hypothetical protein
MQQPGATSPRASASAVEGAHTGAPRVVKRRAQLRPLPPYSLTDAPYRRTTKHGAHHAIPTSGYVMMASHE